MIQVDVEGTKLDVEDTFWYLGATLCSGAGCDSAIAAWPGESSGNYCLSSPPGTSFLRCVARYTWPVLSAMLHGSEKSGPNILDLKQLYHNDRAMICWICDTKDRVETSSVLLLQKLISMQLRWYGHVQRAMSCIKSVTDLRFPRGKGRLRQT